MKTAADIAYTHDAISNGVAAQVKDAATGFFRIVQKEDGRWWTIDPLGHGIVLLGVDHVKYNGFTCEKLGYSPYGRHNSGRYPNRHAWEEETLARLKLWGFNMLGAGCDEELKHRGFIHTIFLNLGMAFSEKGDDYDIAKNEQRPCSAFPNVFHPEFESHCRSLTAQLCAQSINDPWLLGYFIDNELAWWGRGGNETGLFDEVMKKHEKHTAKKALLDYLKNFSKNDIAQFNGLWATQLKNFDEMLGLKSLPFTNEAQRLAKLSFLRFTAERYYAVTAGAIRAADPNHLVLGSRFAGTDGADPVVWEVAGKYCDIATFNSYPIADIDEGVVYSRFGKSAELVAELYAKHYGYVKRPMLITEWSFPALDSGLPCLCGAGQRFHTQKQRTTACNLYARTVLSLPFMLGYDYFMWVDEPALGFCDNFPEDSNYGLIKEDGSPYPLLTGMFTELHKSSVALRFSSTPKPLAKRKLVKVPEGMAIARAAVNGNEAFFENNAEIYRAGNGELTISGSVGEGDMIRTVLLNGCQGSIGRYNAMILVLNSDGQNSWIGTQTVKAVSGRTIDGMAIVDVTGKAEKGQESAEVVHRFILPSGATWFIVEMVSVTNRGTLPLRLKSLFFMAHSEFNGIPLMQPPNLWNGPIAGCWLNEEDGLYFGTMAHPLSEFKIEYRPKHPDSQIEIEEVVIAPGAAYKPMEPVLIICMAGHARKDGWSNSMFDLGKEIFKSGKSKNRAVER